MAASISVLAVASSALRLRNFAAAMLAQAVVVWNFDLDRHGRTTFFVRS
jgi:hypothetical protein